MEQTIIPIDLGNVNCYLIRQNDNYILVDTGGYIITDKEMANRRDKLISSLKTHGCTPTNLKLIILTHGDIDHAANAFFISNYYDCPIALHTADYALVEKPTLDVALKSFNYKSILLKIIFKLLKNVIRTKTKNCLDLFESFTPDIDLSKITSLDSYGFDIKVIPIPGHTEGSIGLITSDNSLISGDTLVNLKKPSPAINAYDFKLLGDSISKILTNNIIRVYPGHGKPFNISELKS